MSQSFFGTTQLRLDVLHFKTTNIFEFDSLKQIPDTFLRIQFWRIARQPFEMNAFGPSFCQVVFDGLTSMNRSAIPDDQQLTGNLTREDLQKANDIWACVRMILSLHNDLSFGSESANGREMITSQLDFQNGRFANGGIGAHRQWQHIKGGLIYENNRPFFVCGFFFNSSQRCSFQLWIAASLRCVAFWMGFCRLYLRLRSRRLQWAGW